jgi:predicted regulator of Ras-like GTPase activity (Roadblock/LC7/MglB family)
MRDILTDLNAKSDALGSMVITPDGILVAASLRANLEEDAMAAFAASLLFSLKKSLESFGHLSQMKCCMLAAQNAKVFFFDMANSFLVLISGPAARVNFDSPAVQEAVDKITNRRIA